MWGCVGLVFHIKGSCRFLLQGERVKMRKRDAHTPPPLEAGCFLLGTIVLVEHGDGLGDLGVEGIGSLEEVEKLGVVHVKEHTGDLAGKLGLPLLDADVEALSKELLLLLERDVSEDRGGQGLLAAGELGGAGGGSGLVGLGTHGLVNTVADTGVELVAPVAVASERGLAGGDTTRASHPGAGGTRATGGTLPGGPDAAGTAGHLGVHELGVLARGTLLRGVPPGPGGHHGVETLAGQAAVEHGGVAHGAGHGTSLLGEPHLHAGVVLGLEGLPADLLALGEGDIDGLVANHLAVHLGERLGGLLLRGEAHESKAPGVALLVNLDLGRGDGAEGGELLAKLLVVDGVIEVLDVEVDTLE